MTFPTLGMAVRASHGLYLMPQIKTKTPVQLGQTTMLIDQYEQTLACRF